MSYSNEMGKTEKSYPIIDQRESNEMASGTSRIRRSRKNFIIENNNQIERMRSYQNNHNMYVNKDLQNLSYNY